MPAIIETFRWCSQNVYFVTTVPSSTHGEYQVSYDHGKWRCGCRGFAYRGKCRHIDEAKKHKCNHGFDAVMGSPSYDWTEDSKCPECGSRAVAIRVAI